MSQGAMVSCIKQECL